MASAAEFHPSISCTAISPFPKSAAIRSTRVNVRQVQAPRLSPLNFRGLKFSWFRAELHPTCLDRLLSACILHGAIRRGSARFGALRKTRVLA
jgi:hypothetical protein